MTDSRGEAVAFDRLFASIDAMDTGRFLGFIAPDAEFRFGSAPAVHGHDAIRDAVDGFFATISALEHEPRRTIVNGSDTVCEGISTYTRHDGSKVTLPFCNVFETANGKITTYRIYIDIAPLYA